MDIRSGVIIFGVYIFQAGWMDGGVEGGSFFFFSHFKMAIGKEEETME